MITVVYEGTDERVEVDDACAPALARMCESTQDRVVRAPADSALAHSVPPHVLRALGCAPERADGAVELLVAMNFLGWETAHPLRRALCRALGREANRIFHEGGADASAKLAALFGCPPP